MSGADDALAHKRVKKEEPEKEKGERKEKEEQEKQKQQFDPGMEHFLPEVRGHLQKIFSSIKEDIEDEDAFDLPSGFVVRIDDEEGIELRIKPHAVEVSKLAEITVPQPIFPSATSLYKNGDAFPEEGKARPKVTITMPKNEHYKGSLSDGHKSTPWEHTRLKELVPASAKLVYNALCSFCPKERFEATLGKMVPEFRPVDDLPFPRLAVSPNGNEIYFQQQEALEQEEEAEESEEEEEDEGQLRHAIMFLKYQLE